MPSLPPSTNRPRAREQWRGKTKDRGYDAAHRRLREAVLAEQPYCQLRIVCRGAMATDLDHIIPISERPDLRLERSNVQSSCGPCNTAKRNGIVRKVEDSSAKPSVFVSLQASANGSTAA